MSESIEQRVAIVTGSSRGIGRGIAERLGAAGFRVVVNYAHNQQAASETLQSLQQLGGDGVIVQADVAQDAGRAALVETAMSRWGRLDVLVNNAGITSPGRPDVLDATPENWDLVFDTNLKGPFFLAQLAAKQMIEPSRSGVSAAGTIINVSSISAFAVSTNRPDYCIAKSAVPMMTRMLAARLADDGVFVFEICPGIVASDMTAPVQEKYDRLIADGLTPIRRWGQPADVAEIVVSLVNGGLPFCTGQTIFADGGFHIRQL